MGGARQASPYVSCIEALLARERLEQLPALDSGPAQELGVDLDAYARTAVGPDGPVLHREGIPDQVSGEVFVVRRSVAGVVDQAKRGERHVEGSPYPGLEHPAHPDVTSVLPGYLSYLLRADQASDPSRLDVDHLRCLKLEGLPRP